MGEYIKVKHSFNAGDLTVILAGLRQLYIDTGKRIKLFQRLNLPAFFYDNQINSTVDKDGIGVCMNDYLFSMIKPLIEAQDYIESFEVWEGQAVDLDYDLTRDSRIIPMPSGLIHSWYESVFPQTSTDLSKSWIKVQGGKEDYSDKIIVNRTQRYVNPYISYYFLKDYEDKIIFSGTDEEHEYFNSQWKLKTEKLIVSNFYHLAQVIASCKFGIYNQSLNFHIADAMKTKRILELCPPFPNTFITGANGYQFYRQHAVEYYVNKLMK